MRSAGGGPDRTMREKETGDLCAYVYLPDLRLSEASLSGIVLEGSLDMASHDALPCLAPTPQAHPAVVLGNAGVADAVPSARAAVGLPGCLRSFCYLKTEPH